VKAKRFFVVENYDGHAVVRAVSARLAKRLVRGYRGERLTCRPATQHDVRKYRQYLKSEL